MSYVITDENEIYLIQTQCSKGFELKNVLIPSNAIIKMLESFENGQNDFRTMQHDIAEETFLKWKNSSFFKAGLVCVHEPENDIVSSTITSQPIFVQRVNLSQSGIRCLDTIKHGCCWNLLERQIDIKNTVEFYNYWLDIEIVPEEVFQIMERLSSNEPIINNVRKKLLAFKLKSNKVIVGNTNIYMGEN